MDTFTGKIAVVTGAGSGMGHELARLLSAEGCHVALCDVRDAALAETVASCEAAAPPGTRLTTHLCDVSDEGSMLGLIAHVEACAECRFEIQRSRQVTALLCLSCAPPGDLLERIRARHDSGARVVLPPTDHG